jgi:hypothetical protein
MISRTFSKLAYKVARGAGTELRLEPERLSRKCAHDRERGMSNLTAARHGGTVR